jgi:hypothetical protein
MNSNEPADRSINRVHPPEKAEMRRDTQILVTEAARKLESRTWTFPPTSRDQLSTRHYVAASIRHISWLLVELDRADSIDLNYSLRLLSRTLFDAFILGLYAFLKGEPAAPELRANYAKYIQLVYEALKRENASLLRDSEAVEGDRVSDAAMHYLKQTLDGLGKGRKDLDISKMATYCSKELRARGITNSRIEQIHNFYRFQSLLGPHTNIRVLSEYVPEDCAEHEWQTIRSPRDRSHGNVSRAYCILLQSVFSIVVFNEEPEHLEGTRAIYARYNDLAKAETI